MERFLASLEGEGGLRRCNRERGVLSVPLESSVRQVLDVEDSPGFPVKEIEDDVPCSNSIFYTRDTRFAHAY